MSIKVTSLPQVNADSTTFSSSKSEQVSPSPYIKKYQQLMTHRTVSISDKLKNMNQKLVMFLTSAMSLMLAA